MAAAEDAGSQRSSSSSSSSEDVRVPSSSKYANPRQDLCRVTIVTETCAEERTCSDCMDVSVPERSDGCYLDATSGICQSFSQLTLSQETTKELNASAATSTPRWKTLETASIFTSTHRQYCRSLDSACTLCSRVANNAQFVPSEEDLERMSADKRVCYGADGCICVAACQSAERISYTSTRCPVSTQPASTQSSMVFPSTQLTVVFILSLFLLARCLVEYIRIRWARRRRDASSAAVASGGGGSTRPARGASNLRLSGWIAWHRELRELEKNGELRYVELEIPKLQERCTEASTSHVEADNDVVILGSWSPRSSV